MHDIVSIPSPQLRVRVADGGTPAKVNVTTVKASVNRNFNDPRFEQSRYSARIEESAQIGSYVTTVTGSDADRKVGSGDGWKCKVIPLGEYA